MEEAEPKWWSGDGSVLEVRGTWKTSLSVPGPQLCCMFDLFPLNPPAAVTATHLYSELSLSLGWWRKRQRLVERSVSSDHRLTVLAPKGRGPEDLAESQLYVGFSTGRMRLSTSLQSHSRRRKSSRSPRKQYWQDLTGSSMVRTSAEHLRRKGRSAASSSSVRPSADSTPPSLGVVRRCLLFTDKVKKSWRENIWAPAIEMLAC